MEPTPDGSLRPPTPDLIPSGHSASAGDQEPSPGEVPAEGTRSSRSACRSGPSRTVSGTKHGASLVWKRHPVRSTGPWDSARDSAPVLAGGRGRGSAVAWSPSASQRCATVRHARRMATSTCVALLFCDSADNQAEVTWSRIGHGRVPHITAPEAPNVHPGGRAPCCPRPAVLPSCAQSVCPGSSANPASPC